MAITIISISSTQCSHLEPYHFELLGPKTPQKRILISEGKTKNLTQTYPLLKLVGHDMGDI